MALNNPRRAIIVVLILAAATTLYFAGRNFLEKCYYPPILMYHSIDDHWRETKLSVSLGQFRGQMKFLREKKYDVVPLERLVDMIKSGRKLPHNIVAVTFDDGNLNNYTNALPVLKEYKIPATMFVVSDWIGKPDHLNAAQIKEISAAGIDFGSHTKTHPYMEPRTKDELKIEILESKKAIEAVTGKPVVTFCFPYGGKNEYARDILRDTGFKAAFLSMPRDNSIKLDLYQLKRIKVSPGPFNLVQLGVKVSGYYTWFKAHRWGKKKSTGY
jgi:peptidoglycan/xylan/chitin deacetylase (PgdA/CDA1 family)